MSQELIHEILHIELHKTLESYAVEVVPRLVMPLKSLNLQRK